MAYCGEHSLVKYAPRERVALSVRCRSWSCQECGHTRRKMLIAEAIGGAPTTFLTLTVKRGLHETAAQAARALAKCWRLLRLRAMRNHHLKSLEFIAVFEATKAGWPHLHILARMPYVPQTWLSAQMRDLLQSPVVWIERLNSTRKIASYVAKYCGKDPHRFETCKRYWSSRKWNLRRKPDYLTTARTPGGWERDTQTLDAWCRMCAVFGWRVERVSKWKAVASLPP